jgi:hypothetical protein
MRKFSSQQTKGLRKDKDKEKCKITDYPITKHELNLENTIR